MHKLVLLIWIAATASGETRDELMNPTTLEQLIAATGGQPVGIDSRDVPFARITIDSRAVQPGDVFWALAGERHDGHHFINEAHSRGALASVVGQHASTNDMRPAIVVSETLHALSDFAHWYRHEQDALVMGVTGSFGKTTTRDMIHAALSTAFAGTRSPKNFNNHFGLPLSLLTIESQHDFAVLELAASRLGEISELARIADPEIGVITGIGAAHLDGFGSIENVVAAKSELLQALPSSGFAVLTGDDPRVASMARLAGCPVIMVGEQRGNDVRATEVRVGNNRLEFVVDSNSYTLNVAGRHHLTAALTAIAIGREFHMDHAGIAAGLQSFVATPGRCQSERVGDWTVIDDSYNANPSSVSAACRTLSDWQGGHRKLLIAGDMLELGTAAARLHFEFGESVAGTSVDNLLAFGTHATDTIRGAMRSGMSCDRLAVCEDFETALTVLDCWLEPEDVVLVKGSRGMRMERVVEWMRQRAANSENLKQENARLKNRVCA